MRKTSQVTREYLTSDVTRIAPEMRPFNNAAKPRTWMPEDRPTVARKVNGVTYLTSGDAVYRFYDAHRRLLYIGMTTSHPVGRWNGHRKNAEWWGLAAFVSVEWIFDKTTAAVEKAAIRAEQPLYNKQHVRSRFPSMAFTHEEPATIIEQFRAHLLPDDFAALVRAFKAEPDVLAEPLSTR
jgi:hypothetical protein